MKEISNRDRDPKNRVRNRLIRNSITARHQFIHVKNYTRCEWHKPLTEVFNFANFMSRQDTVRYCHRQKHFKLKDMAKG